MESFLFFAIIIMMIAVAMYIGYTAGVRDAARRARTVSMILTLAAQRAGADFPAFMDEANRLLDEEIAK